MTQRGTCGTLTERIEIQADMLCYGVRIEEEDLLRELSQTATTCTLNIKHERL
jgi:hypothetical protein